VLHTFLITEREAIIARTRAKLSQRPSPRASTLELENGVPLFLSQLSDTLRMEMTATPFPAQDIGASAARHGHELLALGFSVSQVVHGYGDICQAVTELAIEQHAPITTEEFHTLNRCLDVAIAEAVTEHARMTEESRSSGEVERLGQLAHEIRNMVSTALFAFRALKLGTVAINGSTGAVLGRTLAALHDLVASTVSDVRLAADLRHLERIPVQRFVAETADAARLHGELRGVALTVAPLSEDLAVVADRQLLESALTNLLTNAIKYTRVGGEIALRVSADDNRVYFEVEDQCGGMPEAKGDPFEPFAEQRGHDRTGLGLGLSIARRAIRAQHGDISIRNMPGTGCIFAFDLPLAIDIGGGRPPA
jgi:signal transduction histidine kinase